MLTLLTGVAHSGKTAVIYRQMLAAVQQGNRALLIVPEQASFANERALQRMAGNCAHRAEVFSFSRLAQQLLRRLGGRDREPLDEAATILLMSVALDELGDALTVYRRHYRSRGFLEQLGGILAEFQNAGVTPEQLAAFALSQPQGALRDKLHELSLIYDCYEAVLHRSYLSPNDLLALSAKRLAGSGRLQGAQVFVDDFGSFTAPELQLLSALLGEAQSVTVALCCDGVQSEAPAFSLARDTCDRLRSLALHAGVAVQEQRLPAPTAVPAALAAMEQAVRDDGMPTPAQVAAAAQGGVTAIACSSPYDELEQTAAHICRLVQQQGYRWREIAVLTRDMGRYAAALPIIFGRYELPYFLDVRNDAASNVLTGGLLEAVRLAARAREADWLALARCPLCGLDAQQAAALENYCFVWLLQNAAWERPFTQNPAGLADGMGERAAAELAALEALREQLVTPVLSLRRAMQTKKPGRFAKGLWQYMGQCEAVAHLQEFAGPMPVEEKRLFLEEQSLVYEQIVHMLELFDAVSPELAMQPERMLELIEISFAGFDVATVPRTLDEVTVGTADRTRCEGARAVFLLGAVEGEFPSCAMPGGLLSEPERRRMAEGGLTLFTEGDRSQATERMFCYRAVTAPAERLYLLYPRADATGGQLLPSELFVRAQALCAPPQEVAAPLLWSAATLAQATAAALRTEGGQGPAQRQQNATLQAAGARLLPAQEYARLQRAAKKTRHRLQDTVLARQLFGQRMALSPSRVEQYYGCAFSYYMQKGLRARPRRRVELSPVQSGSLIHRVLERIVSRHGGKGLSQCPAPQLKAEIAQEIQSYLRESFADLDSASKRLLRNIERLGDWLFDMLLHLGQELAQSAFEPVAFELQIREGGEKNTVAPLVLRTADGGEIFVEGVVDRVDTATVRGKQYLRVLDYKSGKKSFLLEDVYYGLNLQMLIYLFSIWQNGAGALQGLLPAGALYVPAQGSYLSEPRDIPPEQLAAKQRRQYAMNGLLLSDPDVLSAMEPGLAGVYIPYTEGKKTDALYSLAELGKLRRLVEKKLVDMAEQLHKGNIAATPIDRDGAMPCEYCDYRQVCGFEPGDETRPLLKTDRVAVLADFDDEEVRDDG